MTTAGLQREVLRQQMLLRALRREVQPAAAAGWLHDGERGLPVYRANAGALAERALAAAFPTVLQLLGDESFAALARALWHTAPPARGDLAEWGAALPGYIADDEQLADEAYLADVARLEWAVHVAASAADAAGAPEGLHLLADHDPAALFVRLQAGGALLASAHPIVTLWHAHRSQGEDRFAAVRAAFAAGRGEQAWVRRRGWQVEVLALSEPTARFTGALLAGRSLGSALAEAGEAGEAGEGFDFEPWLLAALRDGAIAAVATETP